MSGVPAYNMYMAVGGARRRVGVEHYSVVSENAQTDVQKLMTKLASVTNPKNLAITSTTRISREINSTIYQISVKSGSVMKPVCIFAHADTCTPYKKILGEYVIAIDYLKYTLYNNIVFSEDSKYIRDGMCMIKYLNKVQDNYYAMQNVTNTDDTPFQRFVIECKGPNENTVKRSLQERWHLRQQRQELLQKKDAIPEECKDVDRDNCKYPCVWNDDKNKCTGLPWGVHRAGGE